MSKLSNNPIIRLGNNPVFCGLSALFGVVAVAGIGVSSGTPDPLTFSTFAISPLVTAALTTTAAVNMFSDRSKLSKIFSGVATCVGALALVGFGTQFAMGSGELIAYAGAVFTTVAMPIAGAFNLLSHYTRKNNANLKSSSEPDSLKP